MALERLQAGAAAGVPDLDGLIAGPRCYCLPSCEKATELTESLWPSSVCRQAPLLASQILTVLIAGPRCHLPAVVRESDRADVAAMALERLQAGAAAGVPDLDGLIA